MRPERKAQLRAELRQETQEWRDAAEAALRLQPEAERLIFQYADKGLSYRDLAEAASGLADGRQVLSHTTVGVIVARHATAGNEGKAT